MRARWIVGVVALAALGAGCAQSGYDATSLQSRLRRAGLTEAQARCVTNGMEDNFDLGQLASHDQPTAAELTTARNILQRCGVR